MDQAQLAPRKPSGDMCVSVFARRGASGAAQGRQGLVGCSGVPARSVGRGAAVGGHDLGEDAEEALGEEGLRDDGME